jgi:dienelactone hydrolase
MRKLIYLCLCLLSFPLTALAQGESYEQLVKRYDYDKRAPLDVKQAGVVRREGGVRVHDISYASLKGGRVPAYLVVPEGKGPFAAILFGHWAMTGSPMRNRTEFLDEAVALARAGAISLLPDAPFARPGFKPTTPPFDPRDIEIYFQQVLDMRRGLDLLLARKDVDPSRVAYVGHSYNANVGGVLSGVDKRFKTFVLMAGSLSDAEDLRSDHPEMVKLRASVGEEKIEQLIRETNWQNPANFVGHAAPASVLLQYAYEDGFLDEARDRRYFALVSEPKELKFYHAGHALNAAARWDRYEWLRAKIGLRQLERAVLDQVREVK